MSSTDQQHNEEALELLKVWYFLKTKNILWPAAIIALEDKINSLLEQPPETWKRASIGPAQQV